ncbi:MAG: hypothetical protein JNL60_02650 [Bacteroidia bacterium]|nr:hypothetical protein [Bacteroidia bacterium]
MTSKKISSTLLKIKSCRQSGNHTEALIRTYHLNLDLIRFLISSNTPEKNLGDKKAKELVNDLVKKIDEYPKLKTLITKKSAKALKPWMEKMDVFFKSLKIKQPTSVSALQSETEKIVAILNISVSKQHAKS